MEMRTLQVPGSGCAQDRSGKEVGWQETRRVVDAYLKRSLSQNAQLSTGYLKPEGYHTLRKNGMLPNSQFQKSTSDYDQWTPDELFHSAPQSRLQQSIQRVKSDRQTISTQPSNSHSFQELHQNAKAYVSKAGSISKETSTVAPPRLITGADFRCSACFGDTPPSFEEEAAEVNIVVPVPRSPNITTSKSYDTASTDSMGEDESGDEVQSFRRRASFHKAVNRKSVLSYIEQKGRGKVEVSLHVEGPQKDAVAGKSAVAAKSSSKMPSFKSSHGAKVVVPASHNNSEIAAATATTVNNNCSSTMNEIPPQNNKTNKESSVKLPGGSNGFCEKLKRMISNPSAKRIQTTPSSKRRARYRKQWEDEKVNIDRNAAYNAASNNHINEPAKGSKKSGKFFRSLSFKQQQTPEMKHLGFSSNNSLFNNDPRSGKRKNSTEIRDKTGSLPSSARFGIRHSKTDYSKINADRRHSEDLLQGCFTGTLEPMREDPAGVPAASTAPQAPLIVVHSPDTKVKRPQHLAIGPKKSKSKLKKILMYLRRQRTHSTTSSTNSSLSLPSIPHAIENEKTAVQQQSQIDIIVSGIDETKIINNCCGIATKPEQASSSGGSSKLQPNRASLSFSHGDLQRLKYDEIAETLERISKSFNRHIYSISSTPCSRMDTPAWELSSNDTNQLSRSSSRLTSQFSSEQYESSKSLQVPPSYPGMTSRGSYSSSAGLYPTNRPATAGPSPTEQLKRSKSPISLQRRHTTHHAPSASFDSSLRVPMPMVNMYAQSGSVDVTNDRDVIDGGNRGSDEIEITITSPDKEDDNLENDVVDTLMAGGDFLPTSHVSTASTTPQAHTPVETSSPQTDQTSSSDIPSTSTGITTQPSSIDEDKLVQLLVQALINRGDQYERSINMQTGLEPMTRRYVADYLGRVTYHRFHNIAGRFVSNVTQMVSDSPTRHPEVLPVVMAFNMISVMYDIANAESTRHYVDHILNLSTRYVNQFVQRLGNSWPTLQNYLQETQQDLERGNQNQNQLNVPGAGYEPHSHMHTNYDEEVD